MSVTSVDLATPAAVVGGGGALLGVLVGLAPGIGVPLVAVAVTGLLVRSRLPMSRRLS